MQTILLICSLGIFGEGWCLFSLSIYLSLHHSHDVFYHNATSEASCSTEDRGIYR